MGWGGNDSVTTGDYPIDVRFTPEARIGRYWGIPVIGHLVRYLLFIPHAFVLFFLGIAAWLLTLVTWIPVLFSGNYPSWGYAIVGGFLRWYMRAASWLLLLSGTYPPFTGAPADDQHVRVHIDEDRPVGRFWGIPIVGIVIRVIILIPHFIVLGLLGILVWFLVLFAWLPVLINGRQASLVYTVVGGYLRWYARVLAYASLMSGPYPPFRLD